MAAEHLADQVQVVKICPSRGLRGLALRELWQYRDLFYFLVWRDIKARYAQSTLGIGWAVIQPVFRSHLETRNYGQ